MMNPMQKVSLALASSAAMAGAAPIRGKEKPEDEERGLAHAYGRMQAGGAHQDVIAGRMDRVRDSAKADHAAPSGRIGEARRDNANPGERMERPHLRGADESGALAAKSDSGVRKQLGRQFHADALMTAAPKMQSLIDPAPEEDADILASAIARAKAVQEELRIDAMIEELSQAADELSREPERTIEPARDAAAIARAYRSTDVLATFVIERA